MTAVWNFFRRWVSRPRDSRTSTGLMWCLWPILLLSVMVQEANGEKAKARLDDFYRPWIAGTRPLMSPAEAMVFEKFDGDVDRELFIRAFWQSRQGVAAPAWDTWGFRAAEARRRFGSLDGDRARAMLLAGVPDRIEVYGGCRGVIKPMRLWHYDRHQAAAMIPQGTNSAGEPGSSADRDLLEAASGFDLVFIRDEISNGSFESWSPADGIAALSENDAPWARASLAKIIAYSREHRCFRTGDREIAILERSLTGALAFERLRGWVSQGRPDGGWLGDFAAAHAAGELRLPVNQVEIGYPGRDARKVLLAGRVRIPITALERGAAGQLFDRLHLTAELHRGRYLADSFQQVVHLVGPTPAGETVPLEFFRRLRPGAYELRLRLEDSKGRALLRQNMAIEVPVLEDGPEIGDGHRTVDGARLSSLTRRDVFRLLAFPGLRILAIGDNPVGRVVVPLESTGERIARVEVELDGVTVGDDAQAPFAVEVDFGSEPATHDVRAVAYDSSGRELARARRRIEPSERPLRVGIEVSGGRATAHVSTPRGVALARVEIYRDHRLLATFERPPYSVVLPESERSAGAAKGFVRALAVTTDGEIAEALSLLDQDLPSEHLDTRWVEVYTTVLDTESRPVVGLKPEAFRVFEDDEAQPLERFEAVDDLPLQVVLAMDTSVSMRDRMETAVASARRFFSTVLRSDDRAALITFNHDLRLAVPFTGEVEALNLGTSGLSTWGGTRFNDAVVFASGYMAGLPGRRALVVLSDGQDVESSMSGQQARDQVLRAGVALYVVVLGLDDSDRRRQVTEMARASGGRAFFIRSVSELSAVYKRIEEELRSQYLLVYRAPPDGGTGFRRIDVDVQPEGLSSRSISGYYF